MSMEDDMGLDDGASVFVHYDDNSDEFMEEDEVLVSSSEDEEEVEAIGQHTFVKIKYENTHIKFNSVKSGLLQKAKECIGLTLQKARQTMGLGNTSPRQSDILNMFLPSIFLIQLQSAINR